VRARVESIEALRNTVSPTVSVPLIAGLTKAVVALRIPDSVVGNATAPATHSPFLHTGDTRIGVLTVSSLTLSYSGSKSLMVKEVLEPNVALGTPMFKSVRVTSLLVGLLFETLAMSVLITVTLSRSFVAAFTNISTNMPLPVRAEMSAPSSARRRGALRFVNPFVMDV
jgi:hypothetical protein